MVEDPIPLPPLFLKKLTSVVWRGIIILGDKGRQRFMVLFYKRMGKKTLYLSYAKEALGEDFPEVSMTPSGSGVCWECIAVFPAFFLASFCNLLPVQYDYSCFNTCIALINLWAIASHQEVKYNRGFLLAFPYNKSDSCKNWRVDTLITASVNWWNHCIL